MRPKISRGSYSRSQAKTSATDLTFVARTMNKNILEDHNLFATNDTPRPLGLGEPARPPRRSRFPITFPRFAPRRDHFLPAERAKAPAHRTAKLHRAAPALHQPSFCRPRSLHTTYPPPFDPEPSQLVLAGRRPMTWLAGGFGDVGVQMRMWGRWMVACPTRGRIGVAARRVWVVGRASGGVRDVPRASCAYVRCPRSMRAGQLSRAISSFAAG